MDASSHVLRSNDVFRARNARHLRSKIHEKRNSRNMDNHSDRPRCNRCLFDMWTSNGSHDGNDETLAA